MTKLQKLEAAARKWAAANDFLARVGVEDLRLLRESGIDRYRPSGDFKQANSDECVAHMDLMTAARELLR